MKVTRLEIPGALLITLKTFPDDRGFFIERFQKASFKENGIPSEFVQDNHSKSNPGVLRGMHLQGAPNPQGKLVTVIRGKVFDAIADLRSDSPSYKKWLGVELSESLPQWLWVPAGCAHGFCVLGDEPAELLYKVDNPYDPKSERGIRWDDPEIKIQWPISAPVLSERDQNLPFLSEARL